LKSNTSNDVVLHKDVPFEGTENKLLHFDPIFRQKTVNFGANFGGKFRVKEALTWRTSKLIPKVTPLEVR